VCAVEQNVVVSDRRFLERIELADVWVFATCVDLELARRTGRFPDFRNWVGLGLEALEKK
jgi:hypothetical protein